MTYIYLFLLNRSEFVWREIVLAAIGEQFTTVLSPDDDICGVTISIRMYRCFLYLLFNVLIKKRQIIIVVDIDTTLSLCVCSLTTYKTKM
jgi:hypothetical protein